MNVFRRLAAQALRNPQIRGGGGGRLNPGGETFWPNGSFWSEGTQEGLNGFKYGEIPPPPGQRRKLQWWEPVWYTYLAISIPAWYITFYGKPLEAQGIRHWARPRAEREIDEDNKVLDKVAESPELLERVKKAAVACGMIEDEAYDLVLMRREWVMRKRLHDGTYPAEVQELFDELEQLSRA